MSLDGNILIENIRMLCKKNKVSMSKLESDLFLSPGLISRWNKSTPALDKVMTIAEYFGVSVDELVGRSKSSPNHPNIERLLILLYNRSMMAEIDWDILNFRNPPERLAAIKMPDLFETDSCSCYFASFRNGFFLLASTYSFDNNLLLRLFTFPDIHSRPECICTDVNMLHQLYEYLDRRFSRKLNNIKSDNFIDAFIKDAAKTLPDKDFPAGDGKITPLRNINDASNF